MYDYTKNKMPMIYQYGKRLPINDLTLLINLPLTWETLCLVDSVKNKFKSIIVTPLSSGKHGSLQSGVVKYLNDWEVDYSANSDDKTKIKALKKSPDIIFDCTFNITEISIDHNLLKSNALIIEDTKIGVTKGRKLQRTRNISNPVIYIDNYYIKQDYENKIGIGYSIVSSMMSLGLFLPKYTVVIIGFGKVGEGISKYIKDIARKVIIVEIRKEREDYAKHLGFTVTNINDALYEGSIIITATGVKNTIKESEIKKIKGIKYFINAGAEVGEWDNKFIYSNFKKTKISKSLSQFSNKHLTIYEVESGNSINLAMGISISEFLDITFSFAIHSIIYFLLNDNNLSGEVELSKSMLNEFDKDMKNSISWL